MCSLQNIFLQMTFIILKVLIVAWLSAGLTYACSASRDGKDEPDCDGKDETGRDGKDESGK